LALLRQLGDRRGEADAWDSLGYVHDRLGHHGEGTACYGQAVDLFHSLGNRYAEAGVLARLGDAHLSAGATADANDAYERALRILDDLGHPDAHEVRGKLTANPTVLT
jgi:tetratricopeptide (TPR) repeat protein